MKRQLRSVHQPLSVTDGAGVKIKRLFPVSTLDHVDPFLLFDHFGSEHSEDFIAGFPLHPHRGIETVTYMLEGQIKHSDSVGNSGVIAAGDVQWMSAGRGIMHEEMPERADGKLSGMQLWVNLPATEKMKRPAYQEYKADSITQFKLGEHQIKLISGELLGRTGNVKNVSSLPLYADIVMQKGDLNLHLPEEHHAFIYVFEGQVQVIGDDTSSQLKAPILAVLSQGSELMMTSDTTARFILAAAQPIMEPIVRWGPFVMNTQQEIEQTLYELRTGQFPPKD